MNARSVSGSRNFGTISSHPESEKESSLGPAKVWLERSNRGLYLSGSLWISDLSCFGCGSVPRVEASSRWSKSSSNSEGVLERDIVASKSGCFRISLTLAGSGISSR